MRIVNNDINPEIIHYPFTNMQQVSHDSSSSGLVFEDKCLSRQHSSSTRVGKLTLTRIARCPDYSCPLLRTTAYQQTIQATYLVHGIRRWLIALSVAIQILRQLLRTTNPTIRNLNTVHQYSMGEGGC